MVVVGKQKKSTYTLLNVCLPVPAEKVGLFDFHLDLKGVACSKGSACQAGSNIGSHVLQEVLCEEQKGHPSIRFSFLLSIPKKKSIIYCPF